MPPCVGMRFGRYELLSRLGAGGMGEVWRARDHDLHRDVAVKFLPEKFATDPSRFSRFSQEARAASSLNHPNIVTIHEIGDTSGLHFIVMELVEGHTLRDLLQTRDSRPFTPRRLLEIGAQIAEGLAKAHAAGIVHRDLKPENVMVTEDGFVKVLDFGLAKLRADGPGGQEQWFDSAAPTWPESPSPQTAVGAVLGTAGYMSPEQARGRSVDHRSDQFSLGAILYEMATGRQPFRRETPAQTIAAIIDDTPEPLHLLCPALPPPVRWLVERCLAKDPGERYASTLDLARELRSLREHLPEVASTGSSPPAGGRAPSPRRRRLAVLGLAAAPLVVAATWLGPPMLDRAAVALRLRAVPADKHIAVLPFRAPGASPEDKALAEGVVDLLTVRLAQLQRVQGSLWVEPSSNVLQAGITSADRAARSLGVTLVITGSVQRLGGRLLLTAAIEDARRNRTLRAVTAGGPEDLAEAVVHMLDLELGAQEAEALRASTTGVAEAATLATQALGYTPYAEGRNALERYEQSRGLERAISLFNRALEQDPRYALAHAGLGEAYWRLYQNEKNPELVPLAERHCERALALDDLFGRAWVTLGMIHAGTGRAEAALADFQKALDRDPRDAEAYRERGIALEDLGRFADAEASYRKAIELRPDLWSGHNYLGAFLSGRARFVEAEAAFKQALRLAPDNARSLSNLAGVYYLQDRLDDAEKAWTRAVALQPSPTAVSNLAALQFSKGRYAESARTLERATATGTRDYRPWRNLGAALYWAPGERAKAADAYRRAAALAEEERRLDPRSARLLAHLADCYGMLGEAGSARGLAAEAVGLAPEDRRVASLVAGVYEHLGDRDAALRWLEVALRHGHPPGDIETDPTFEGLRKDPRWARISASRPGA